MAGGRLAGSSPHGEGEPVASRNIEIILGGLADAVRERDPGRFAALLAPGLVWEGTEPGQRCDSRDQAMRIIRHRLAAAPLTVDAIEAIDAGQHVILGLRGPGFNGIPGDLTTPGQTYHVFTFEGGQVTRWRAYRTRDQALATAGADGPDWR
jgi:hypothetical protein